MNRVSMPGGSGEVVSVRGVHERWCQYGGFRRGGVRWQCHTVGLASPKPKLRTSLLQVPSTALQQGLFDGLDVAGAEGMNTPSGFYGATCP